MDWIGIGSADYKDPYRLIGMVIKRISINFLTQDWNFLFSKIEIFYLVNISIGIGLVLADKKRISVSYQIGQFKKWHLSVSSDMKKTLFYTCNNWPLRHGSTVIFYNNNLKHEGECICCFWFQFGFKLCFANTV